MCKIDETNLIAAFNEPKSSENKNLNYSNQIKIYKINESTMEPKLLSSGSLNTGFSYQLYYKRLYIFGGNDKTYSFSDSKYFDLNNNNWVFISSLPIANYDVSTLLLEPEILIAGCLSNIKHSQNTQSPVNLHSYQIFKNQYKHINSSLTEIYNSSLFLFQGIIYFVNGLNIYTCDDLEGKNKWVHVKKNEKNEFSSNRLSKPCYRGKYAYCYESSGNIYRFDFECLTFSLIKHQ